jgi:hypothetical protein
MRTETADLLGVVLWVLQAVVFAVWAISTLLLGDSRAVTAVLALAAFTAAVFGYRRARALRTG